MEKEEEKRKGRRGVTDKVEEDVEKYNKKMKKKGQ
jgi:hypothetical protein